MRRLARTAGTLLVALIVATAGWGIVPASAAGYNDTSPGTTPCGDGSHAVDNLRSYYIRNSSSVVFGRVDIRYSSYCNTVWTRVVNMTGSGSGYASARTLTADEYIAVFTCPMASCLVDSTKATGDSIAPGKWGFSHQLVLPAGSTLNGAPQPPTVRPIGWVHNGTSTYSRDGGRWPWWTILDNGFNNYTETRLSDAQIYTCDNSRANCMSWGETSAGGARSLQVYLDPNLHNNLGTADIFDDMTGTIVPAWNNVAVTDAPSFTVCTAITCVEQIYVLLAPPTDSAFVGNNYAAVTIPDSNSGPNTMAHRTIKIRNTLSFSHACGTADDGCTVGGDDRPLISHEYGHAYGLGHCDRYSGVLCNLGVAPGPEKPNDYLNGNMHWVPQTGEILALKKLYP
jgi:hypothetical protein